MISFATGLLAGAIHVVSGPDHLAAVAPFAARLVRVAVFLALALTLLLAGDALGLGLLGGQDGGGLGAGLVFEVDVEALSGQLALGDFGHRSEEHTSELQSH